MIWGGAPASQGWYACVMDYGRLPFPVARHWDGMAWDDERGVRAFDGPHADAADALDWAMERCPED